MSHSTGGSRRVRLAARQSALASDLTTTAAPLQIRPGASSGYSWRRSMTVALRNRIVFSAHTTNYARDGRPSARHSPPSRAGRGGVRPSSEVSASTPLTGRDSTSPFDDDLIDPLTT